MLAAPGDYDITLTADGKSSRAKLTVKADPRVALDAAALQSATALAADVAKSLDRDYVGYGELHMINAQIGKIEKGERSEALRAAIGKFNDAIKPLTSGDSDKSENLDAIGELLSSIATDLEGSDRTPTQPQRDVLAATNQRLDRALARWDAVKKAELAQLDAQLKRAGQAEIKIPAADQISLDDAPESKDLP
jgi:DNA helicase TIP49 (TBP-interacting protein)